MCIIIYKKPQINLPSQTVLNNCWNNNPDGAGILVHRKSDPERLLISKGYMTKEKYYDYIKTLNLTKDDLIIYHFRIGTSGGLVPEKTHPFPISEDIEALNRTGTFYSTSAFIHNGVFGEGSINLSDTQLYIKDELVQYMKISELDVRKFIISRTAKKCRTITISLAENFIFTTGEWVKDHNGLYFSNSTYKPKPRYEYPYFSEFYQNTVNYPTKVAERKLTKEEVKRPPLHITKCNFFK